MFCTGRNSSQGRTKISCTGRKSPTYQPRKDPFHFYSMSPHLLNQSVGTTPLLSLWGAGTKLLITKFLITKVLITKFPITKFLITKFLITNFLTHIVPKCCKVPNVVMDDCSWPLFSTIFWLTFRCIMTPFTLRSSLEVFSFRDMMYVSLPHFIITLIDPFKRWEKRGWGGGMFKVSGEKLSGSNWSIHKS